MEKKKKFYDEFENEDAAIPIISDSLLSSDATPILPKSNTTIRSKERKKRANVLNSSTLGSSPSSPIIGATSKPVKRRKIVANSSTDEEDVEKSRKVNRVGEEELQQLSAMFPEKSLFDLERVFEKNDRNISAACDELFNAEAATDDDKDLPDITKKESNSKQRAGTLKSRQATTIVISDDEDEKFIHEETKSEDVAEIELEMEAVNFFNSAPARRVLEMTACTDEQAAIIMTLRPFRNYAVLNEKLHDTKGVNLKILEMYFEILDMHRSLDSIIAECEVISQDILSEVKRWSIGAEDDSETGLHISEFTSSSLSEPTLIRQQPELVNPALKLKDYQMLGINWLWLLHKKELSGILADDMGLGKTAQTICFIAHLVSTGDRGPYLIIVPASTVDNWLRELEQWCPALEVLPYVGVHTERLAIRENYENADVVVTTYNTISGAKEDRKFLRKLNFTYMILDEGHMVKNASSQRYKKLTSIETKHRLLITGTPLQNNLQELMALLMFLMPSMFAGREEMINKFFSQKFAATHSDKLLEKAKKLVLPFILRRKKCQVLKDLPKKTESIVHCDPTESQMVHYKSLLTNSRTSFVQNITVKRDADRNRLHNILMELRKMACHPLLHRRLYTLDKLKQISKLILREEPFWDSDINLVYEDLCVMSDFAIHDLCLKYKSIYKFKLDNDKINDCGKVIKLLEILKTIKSKNGRVLIFSQFTMMLDILESVLNIAKFTFRRMDGQTPVSARQTLIDEYQNNSDIDVFLLSTKAGGFGINLTAANYVIIYDIDFNPHNDAQAEDRAHRVGQTREVTVMKLITKHTIEEHIYSCAIQKLNLVKTINVDKADNDKQEEGKVDVSTLMMLLKAELDEENYNQKE